MDGDQRMEGWIGIASWNDNLGSDHPSRSSRVVSVWKWDGGRFREGNSGGVHGKRAYGNHHVSLKDDANGRGRTIARNSIETRDDRDKLQHKEHTCCIDSLHRRNDILQHALARRFLPHMMLELGSCTQNHCLNHYFWKLLTGFFERVALPSKFKFAFLQGTSKCPPSPFSNHDK